MRIAVLFAAALLVQPTSAAAKDELPVIQPTSPWKLRYDEDKCRMMRTFGSGEQQVVLMLDQSGIEPYYTLSLVGQPVDDANGKFMRVQFGEEQPTERSFLKGELEDDTPLIAMHGVNLAPVPPLEENSKEAEIKPIGSVREAAIETIAFSAGLDDPFILETGSLGEPLAAMHTCAADLVKYLGIGDGPNPNLSREPEPKSRPITWVTPSDYPHAMIQRDEEGKVNFRLTVNSKGKPTACHITRSTRPQVFDDAVCLALLKRATFNPALDLQGQPVASYYRSAVRFRLPD